MTTKIEFKTNNAAFEDPAEVGRILRKIAAQIDDGSKSGNVRDQNGNVIGKYRVN